MAVNQYVIIDGKTKKVNKKYAVIDGKTKKIKKEYVVIDGKTKLIFNPETLQQAIFTASGHFTVPAGVTSVDVFCVGGGGGTGGCYQWLNSSGYITQNYWGGSGAGGYTKTATISVTPGENLLISVGAGGLAGTISGYLYDSPASGGTSQYNCTNGGDGGASYVVRSSTGILVEANGGYGGKKNSSSNYVTGVSGGSGGSCGGRGYTNNGTTEYRVCYSPVSGSDGSDGGKTMLIQNGNVQGEYGTPGKGQGYTTRAFGKNDGALYSTSGVTSPNPNTGDGGGEGANDVYSMASSYTGGSGIVIIKWIE